MPLSLLAGILGMNAAEFNDTSWTLRREFTYMCLYPPCTLLALPLLNHVISDMNHSPDIHRLGVDHLRVR